MLSDSTLYWFFRRKKNLTVCFVVNLAVDRVVDESSSIQDESSLVEDKLPCLQDELPTRSKFEMINSLKNNTWTRT
jgi:hypothetical protein